MKKKLQNDKKAFVDRIAFFILCVYIICCYITYIENLPGGMVSLALYAFIAVSAFSVLMKRKIVLSFHFLSYGLFLLICIISLLYSYRASTSLAMSISVLKAFLFSVLMYNIVNSKKRVEIVLAMFGVAATILFVYLLSTDQLVVDERLGNDLVGNANIFANLFMFSALAMVYFLFSNKGKWATLIFWIIFVAQEYALALSASRKNFIIPIVVLFIVMILKTDKKGRKHIITRSIIVAIAACVLLWSIFEVPFLYDAIGYRMEGLRNLFTGEGAVDKSTEIRMWMIDYALELWRRNPILGNGIDTFKVFNTLYGHCYSHNNFVELLCGVGVVGFLAYYSMYFYLFKNLLKCKNVGVEKWYWLFALVGICIFEYGAVTYYMFQVQIFIVLAVIFLTRNDMEYRDE